VAGFDLGNRRLFFLGFLEKQSLNPWEFSRKEGHKKEISVSVKTLTNSAN